MATAAPLLGIEDLAIGFPLRDRLIPAVDGLSLAVAPGETLGIVGESGSGKSLTARAVMGLVPRGGRITGGRIAYTTKAGTTQDITAMRRNGPEIRSLRGREIAMVFQEPMASLSPVHTIGAQIGTPLRHHHGLSARAARRAAIDLLDQVGMASPAEIADQYPHRISGGMRQRAMIAIALSCEPRLLICDEPTTALDVTTEAQIVELLAELQARLGMAMIFISHNVALVSEIADRVVVMYLGRSVESGPARDVLDGPRHPYTRALLRSLPAFADPGSRLEALPGAVPDPLSRPRGCAFHPRCSDRIAGRCDAVDPPFASSGRAHGVRCHLHA
jgi:oligopeptide/dipeptide ABC transporter ATP-binding protein